MELLDAIERSPNPEAQDALYRAAVAAGPAIIPQLEEALKDDRTAEFAAQALAFIGGAQAMQILWKLQSDTRDLSLRRFYYGALGEFDAPEATQTLLAAINRADEEPDRTVTEAAILALTVRSDPNAAPAPAGGSSEGQGRGDSPRPGERFGGDRGAGEVLGEPGGQDGQRFDRAGSADLLHARPGDRADPSIAATQAPRRACGYGEAPCAHSSSQAIGADSTGKACGERANPKPHAFSG